MKVLLVYPGCKGGALEITRHCEDALRRLGVNLEVFDIGREGSLIFDAFTLAKLKEPLYFEGLNPEHQTSKMVNQALIVEAVRLKVELVLVNFGLTIHRQTLGLLRELKIKTALWFGDDPAYLDLSKKISSSYDLFFTHEPKTIKIHQALGANASYLPYAINELIHKEVCLTESEKRRFSSQICFVGSYSPHREEVLSHLREFDLKVWGNGWEKSSLSSSLTGGGGVNQEIMINIFNAAKIAVNIHQESMVNGGGLNCRTFEILGSGTLELVDEREGLKEFFGEGEEIVTYKDGDDLRKKVRYYLEHPEERERIAKKGRELVCAKHTYLHRMREILERVREENGRENL